MNALVVSGGGARGAWAVGAIRALTQDHGLRFDVVVGTSTGALIAPLAALGDLEALRAVYTTTRHGDILRNRLPVDAPVPNAVAALIAGRDAVWGTNPLERTVDRHLTRERWARLVAGSTQAWVSAVDLQTGEIRYFGSHEPGMSRETFAAAMVASASIPVYMSRARIPATGGHWFVDGGARDIMPLGQAIRLGARRIWGILLEAGDLADPRPFDRMHEVLLRYIAIGLNETSRNDVELCELVTREIAWRERLGARLVARGVAAETVMEAAFRETSAEDEPLERDGRRFVAVSLKLIRPPREIGDPLDFDPRTMMAWECAGYDYARAPGNWSEHPRPA